MKRSAGFCTRVALVWIALALPAMAQVMDFENFPNTADCPDGAAGVTQNGLVLDDATGGSPDSCVFGSANPGPNTNGTNVFGWCGTCNPQPLVLTLRRQDGAPITLLSIDLSNLGPGEPGPAPVVLTGYPALGGTPVTLTHNIGGDSYTTVNTPQFQNLSRVEIALQNSPDIDAGLDNIRTQAGAFLFGSTEPVPVMGPVLLGAMGVLLLLVGARRLRQRT